MKVLVKKRNYGEAFRELVSDGRIEDALELGLEHIYDDPGVPSQELIPLLHYKEFQQFLASLRGTLDDEKQFRTLSQLPVLPADIFYELEEWASLSSMIQGSNIRDMISGLEEGFHQDLLSVAVGIINPQRY